MPLSARDVASELRKRLPDLPVTSEHKLLYYCQGHHLAATGAPLFAETISAWDMGPVVGQLWYEERQDTQPTPQAVTDEAALNTIGYVVSRYGGLRPADLVRLTHTEPPWILADAHRLPQTSAKISTESLRRYFASSESDGSSDDTSVVLDSEAVAKWLAGLSAAPDMGAPADTADDLRRRANGG